MINNISYPQLQPYNVSFGRQDPVIQQLYLEGVQAQKGIPVQSQLFDIGRMQLSGANRSAINLGL